MAEQTMGRKSVATSTEDVSYWGVRDLTIDWRIVPIGMFHVERAVAAAGAVFLFKGLFLTRQVCGWNMTPLEFHYFAFLGYETTATWLVATAYD
jgi:hypothetical protein